MSGLGAALAAKPLLALGLTLACEALILPGAYLLQSSHQTPVPVEVDGTLRWITARGETVDEILKREMFLAGRRDIVLPDRATLARNAKKIRVVRVDVRRFTTLRRIPHRISTRTTSRLHVGEMIDLVVGSDGLKRQDEMVVYHDGKEIDRWSTIENLVRRRQDGKVLVGASTEKRAYMMRRRMKASKTLALKATAYNAGPESCAPYDDGYTSQGFKAVYGVAAVDPKMIDLGSELYIEGYGYAVAVDTGPAIKKKRIDLCYDSLEEARAFGRKSVRVYVLQ